MPILWLFCLTQGTKLYQIDALELRVILFTGWVWPDVACGNSIPRGTTVFNCSPHLLSNYLSLL